MLTRTVDSLKAMESPLEFKKNLLYVVTDADGVWTA